MIRPRRGILTSLTGPNLFVQAAPVGTSGFFTMEPTNVSAANTFITAYNGVAAVAGNEIGLNFQTTAVAGALHAKYFLPMPFTNGLYLVAGTNNIDWIYYVWDQNINLESLVNLVQPQTEVIAAGAGPGGTTNRDIVAAPAGSRGWCALCPAFDGGAAMHTANSTALAYDGNGVMMAVANQLGYMITLANNGIYTPMGHPWPFVNGVRVVVDNDTVVPTIASDWIVYIWPEQIAL